MNNRIVASLCVLCAILYAAQSASAQGSLTPPGAPAPTMLTLSQVEPRTPITNTTAVTISASGSYYLTANITVTTGNAISINASGVTLDLNGFTIASTSASPSGNGILLAPELPDITILNGHITGNVIYASGSYTGGGFVNGINYNLNQPFNVRVSGVSVSGCGTYGIYLGTDNSTVVESCTVKTVGAYGIVASSVTHSTAYQCGFDAITANIASDCYGYSTGGNGFTVSQTANNCYGHSIGGCSTCDGLDANNANNSYGGATGAGNGLNVTQTATGCSGQNNNGGTGLDANNANNCYGNCGGNGIGLNATETATGCSGRNSGNGTGLNTANANNCNGYANGTGTGLAATRTATGCYGESKSGTGLATQTATGCSGKSDGDGDGLEAETANNCVGQGEGSGHGFNAPSGIATGCAGYSASGPGLFALAANNCRGFSTSGSGLVVDNIAIGCFGTSLSGTGLVANVANSCEGSGTTPYSVANKYNMP
jgi:hypothetical protein